MLLRKWGFQSGTKKLTQEEENVLSDYKPGSYAINLYLRKGLISTEDLPMVTLAIRLLDSAIKKAKLSKSEVLFRGTAIGEIEDKRIKCFTYTPGYLSTSPSADVAVKQFASKKKDESALLRIKIKKGHHGRSLPGRAPWAQIEKEILIERDSVFIIKREKTITDPRRISIILGVTDVKLLKMYSLIIIKNRCLKYLIRQLIIFTYWLKEKL